VGRTAGKALMAYSLVGGLALGGLGGAAAIFLKDQPELQKGPKSKTVLEMQAESAREIRQALARPVAAPEPLPPISSKLHKPETTVIAEARMSGAQKPKRSDHLRKLRLARELFASVEPGQRPQSPFQFLAFGPDGH